MYRQDMPELDHTTEDRIDWEHNIPIVKRLIKNMKANGMKDTEVAKMFGLSGSALKFARKKYPPIDEAYMEGKADCVKVVIAELFKKAIGGEVYTETTVDDIVFKGEVTGKKKKVVRKTAEPDFKAMEMILTNLDAGNWTKAHKADTNRKRMFIDGKTEADKINRLAEGILGDGSNVTEAEFTVPSEAAHSTGSGQADAADVPSDMQGEASDNVQDDALDVPAEAGTERT